MSDLKQRLLSYRPDRANGALLPAGLALLLLAGAALQLALPQGAAVPPALGVWRAPDRRLPVIAEVPAPDLGARASLFSPLRVIGRQGGAPDEPIVPRRVGPLDGTFVLGSVQVGRVPALLLREDSGRVLRLAPGGTYHGWHLLRIEADGARFLKNGATRRIDFGASAPASSESETFSE